MQKSKPGAGAGTALSAAAFHAPEDHIRRIASGDSEAVAALYDQTSSLVYGLALRILGDVSDAEEITLDVYTQVWRSAAKFDSERGSALAWLVMLTRSRSIDRLRSRSDRDVREMPIADNRPPRDVADLPDEASFIRQQRVMVEAALAGLAPEQRELIELAFFSGLTHSELAMRTGLPLGTVKTRIRLGIIKLRELLAPMSESWTVRQ
jgi:RNA polymerase sigma-70 factor (ECF subfamily)